MRVLAGLITVMLVAVAVCAAGPADQAGRCTSTSSTSFREKLPLDRNWDLPYYSNFSLAGNRSVSHAVVVVHGILRNPHTYFRGMLGAANAAGVAGQTIVIAPDFQAHQDHPAAGEPYWTKNGCKRGDDAVAPAGLSSFTVLDQILAALADKARFPNLTGITVAGHSAGAQFVQRYAAVGRPPSPPGLSLNYVVANPSAYLYFTPYRPYPVAPGCAANNYEYGMTDPNHYIGSRRAAAQFAQYATQRVTYLQGGADVLTGGKASHDLDTSCAAEAQGPNRFQRSTHFSNYVHAHFPNAPQYRVVVPGVGHDNGTMFGSAQGLVALFHPAAVPR